PARLRVALPLATTMSCFLASFSFFPSLRAMSAASLMRQGSLQLTLTLRPRLSAVSRFWCDSSRMRTLGGVVSAPPPPAPPPVVPPAPPPPGAPPPPPSPPPPGAPPPPQLFADG